MKKVKCYICGKRKICSHTIGGIKPICRCCLLSRDWIEENWRYYQEWAENGKFIEKEESDAR